MSFPPLSSRLRRLALATTLSLVAIAVVMVAHLFQMRGEIERDGRRELSSVTVFLAFEANRQLMVARLIGEESMDAWGQGGTDGGMRARVEALFAQGLRNDPVLREIALVNVSGEVLAASDAALVGERIDGSSALFVGAGDGVHVGPAQAGRSLGKPGAASVDAARDGFFTLTVARGELRVIVVLGAPSVLNHYGRLTNDGGAGGLRLHRYDGQLLASTDAADGRSQTIFRDFLPHVERGEFVDTVPGGGDVYAFFATLADFPIVVEYRKPDRALLASWQAELKSSLVTLAIVSLIVLLFSFAVFRTLRQLDRSLRVSAAAQHRFRTLFNHSTEAHLLIEEGRITDCNPAALRMVGADARPALIGQEPGAFLPLRQRDGRDAATMVRALVEDPVADDGVPMQIELSALDGRLIVAELRLASIRLDNRPGRLAALRDVTAQLEHEAELTAARDAAQAAARAKSSFLAVMSHELRTPMNGILGMADLLAGSRLDPEQQDHLDTLRRSGQLLLTILNDVLDFSKIEADQLKLEAIPFSPLEAAREVLKALEPAADAQGNRVRLEADLALPRVIGDPTRFRQILFNLVGNAVKFTRDGDVVVRLRTQSVGGGHVRLRCDVEDTGVGVDPVVSARLFNAFEQGDSSTTRRFGGTGLGLAICRRLIEAMDGRIGLLSAPGPGARFWFELSWPLARGDGQPEGAAPPPVPGLALADERHARAGAAAPGGFRLLVAEDNATNRALIKAMLGRRGHAVTMAEDGEQALQSAAAADYDLILMDMQMPRRDGHSAAAAIRRLAGARGAVPIVALTADALAEERERALSSGLFQDYLTKPIDWPVLHAAIERLARGASGAIGGDSRPR